MEQTCQVLFSAACNIQLLTKLKNAALCLHHDVVNLLSKQLTAAFTLFILREFNFRAKPKETGRLLI